MKPEIVVFRYGHRPYRDERVTTHCCLVSRAFGCKKIIIHGTEDKSLSKTIKGVNKQFGGNFKVEFQENWRKALKQLKSKKYTLVHLTMYGLQVEKVQSKLRKCGKIAIIVGSQKVPTEIYEMSDYNISVTGQPHSEIGALAVCLDRIRGSQKPKFNNGNVKILPNTKGKTVIKRKR